MSIPQSFLLQRVTTLIIHTFGYDGICSPLHVFKPWVTSEVVKVQKGEGSQNLFLTGGEMNFFMVV